MPRGDGTGPMGRGAMTGRGLGYCKGTGYGRFADRPNAGFGLGCRRGYGHGFGRGFGLGYFEGPEMPKDEKEFLKQQKEFFKERLDAISKQLEE